MDSRTNHVRSKGKQHELIPQESTLRRKIEKGPRTFPLPFPLEEYEQRLARIRQAMEAAGVEVALVTMPRDFHWLTGSRVDFWASESPQWVIIGDGEPIGVVRHLEAATHRCCSTLKKWVEYFDEGPINPYDPVGCVANALKTLGWENRRIGLNSRVTSLEEYDRFQHLLPAARFVDFRVERLRVKRSAAEIACIRRAVKVNQDALMETIEEMQIGWSEWGILRHISLKHAQALKEEYFRSPWGATSCQVGRHMMHMHATRTPTEMRKQRIKPGDGVWLEPGVFVKEYVGCMIRTVWFGDPPPEVRRAIAATAEAFDRLSAVLAPGKTAGEVDAAARDFLRSQGLDFQHRSGYMANEKWQDGGILSLTPDNPLLLEPGHVFHCPIHVHLPEIGYVGVSEQVLITDTGCEVLGDRDRSCPRQLFVKP